MDYHREHGLEVGGMLLGSSTCLRPPPLPQVGFGFHTLCTLHHG